MTESLSLTLSSTPVAMPGMAGGPASDSTGASGAFDALLSAQIVATSPANPANSAASPLPSAASPAIASAAVPVPVAPLPVASPLRTAPVAIVSAPGEAAADAAPATPQAVPPAVPGVASAIDLPVAVAGNLPESGKSLPAAATLPANAAPVDGDGGGKDAKATRKSRAESEPASDDDTATPAPPPALAIPVQPLLAIAPASAPLAPQQPAPAGTTSPDVAASPAISAGHRTRVATADGLPQPAERQVSTTAGPVARSGVTAPHDVAADATVAAAAADTPAMPRSGAATPATPAAVAVLPLIPGVALTIASAGPAMPQAIAQPTAQTLAPATDPIPATDDDIVATPSRDYAHSPSPLATATSVSLATRVKSAAPGGQGDLGHGQPPMADPSLTSPAGPSPVVSPEATRGPATPLAAPIVAATAPLFQPVAVPPASHDMTALVDRLVEARAAARAAASPMTVTTAVRHAEFGAVSLRFDTAGDGLSVTLASSDPGFAPAAQAALASQSLAPAAGGAADPSGQQNPQRHAAPEPGSAPFQNGNAAGGFAQNQPGQQQPQGQQSPAAFAAANRPPARPAAARDGTGETADPSTNRSGVFA